MTLKAGTKLGPYEILSPLGAGGMGEVYRAADTALGRDVAVKVLPAEVASSPERLQRFEREAKTVATLNHPNIVTIHGIHSEGDLRFIAMELVEGETLDRMIAPGGMPLARIFDLAIPLADALATAHDNGIVHRDLKPANVMVTKEGRVKVLDFGLAKLTAAGQSVSSPDDVTMSAPLTGRGMIIGTIPYMAPEQLRCESVDHRTDLFSLGIMLYEMSTGHRPFEGKKSADMMSAILRDTPRPLHELNGVLPRHLGRIIEHCLEKNAEERFQSAKDVRNELRALRKEVDSGSELAEPVSVATTASQPPSLMPSIPSASAMSAPTRRGEFWIGVGVIGIILISGFWFMRSGNESSTSVLRKDHGSDSAAIVSLAVVPLENVSGDPAQEYFVDAMTGAITDDLARISALTVIGARTMMRYKRSEQSLPEIAKAVGASALVTGTAVQVGDRVRISVQLIEASTRRQLWSQQFDRDKQDILAVQSEVARAVAHGIKVQLTPFEKESLASAPRVNWQAYDAYIRGLARLRQSTRSSCLEAIGLFDQAVAIDSTLARALAAKASAYRALASTHLPPKDTLPEMARAAQEALGLDSSLAEAHIALGDFKMQYNWDWDGARESYQQALASGGKRGSARLSYATWLCAMNRLDEAMAQLDMVQELDPATRYNEVDYGLVSFMARRYERTIRDARAALAFDPEFWHAHEWLGLAESQRGHSDDAISHLSLALELGKSPQTAAMLGGVLAVAGRTVEARAIRQRLKKRMDIEYVCPYEVATISIGLNEFDQAFEEISEACDDRAECIPWLQVDPRLDPIRDDRRFDKILEHVGFEPTHPTLTIEESPGGRIMMAVLPFANLSGDPEQEYFSDGVTEEMITTLGRLSPKRLGVIARTSAMRYKKTDKPIDQIGRELGVAYVLEGGVRRAGGSVRINAQLIQVSDQTQLWGDSYTRDLSDVFAVQEEVAESIAEALAVELLPEEQIARSKAPTASAAAYDAYLLGRSYWAKRTPESLHTAIKHFKRAIELDPNYALAYCGLADAWSVMPYYVPGPYNKINAEAMKAAKRALALNDSLAEAHVSMASVLADSGELETANEHFQKAIEIDPNNATAHQWYGYALSYQQRYDQAAEEYEKAIALDPLSAVIHNEYGHGSVQARRFDKAIEQLNKALRLQPNFKIAHLSLTWSYIGKEDHDAAATAFESYQRAINRPAASITAFRRTYDASGLRAGFLEWLDSLGNDFNSMGIGPERRAPLYAWCDEKDRAFESLDRAIERGSPLVNIVATYFPYDNLRDDPRYADLLKRIAAKSRTEEVQLQP